jgi:hypothetical protein
MGRFRGIVAHKLVSLLFGFAELVAMELVGVGGTFAFPLCQQWI